MGVNESKDQKVIDNLQSPTLNTQNVDQIFGNYTLLNKFNDLRYGTVKLVKDKRNGELYILKEILVNTKESYDKEAHIISQRQARIHPNIIRVIGYLGQDKQDFCSHFYKISIFIEFHERDLDIELNDRIRNQNPYTEPDLLYMMENLISGLCLIQTQNYAHGDVRPINIFVANDGSYKISDPNLLSQRPNSLIQSMMGNAKCYLSPQLLAALQRQDFKPKVDPYKVDVFSFGITLLSCATLSKAEEFYDYEKGVMNYLVVAERLQKLQKNYSALVYELISEMLKIDEEERPDFIKLKEILRPHAEAIQKKEVLIVDSPKRIIDTPERVRKSSRNHSERITYILNSSSPLNVDPLSDFDISAYSYAERVEPVITQNVNSQIQRINVGSYSPARLITSSEQPTEHYSDQPKSQFYKETTKNDSNDNFLRNIDFAISLPYMKEYHGSSEKKPIRENLIKFSPNKKNYEDTKENSDPNIFKTFGNESSNSHDNKFPMVNNLQNKSLKALSLASHAKPTDLIIDQPSYPHQLNHSDSSNEQQISDPKAQSPQMELHKFSLSESQKSSPTNCELNLSPTSRPQVLGISQSQPVKSSDFTPKPYTPFYQNQPLEKSFISMGDNHESSKEIPDSQTLKLSSESSRKTINPLEEYDRRVKEALKRSQQTLQSINQNVDVLKQAPVAIPREIVTPKEINIPKEMAQNDYQGGALSNNVHPNSVLDKKDESIRPSEADKNVNVSSMPIPENRFNFRFDNKVVDNLTADLLNFYQNEYANAKNKLNKDAYQYT